MRMKDRQPPICQYCNQPIRNFAISRHEQACVKNPAVRELLLRWLPNPDYPSRIRTMENYKEGTPNSPSSEYLCNLYGSWRAVAAALDLDAPITNAEKHRMKKKMATIAEILRISQKLHDGKWSPTYREYDRHRIAGTIADGPMQGERLIISYGSWAAALEHYGLPPVAPPEAKKSPVEDDGRNYCTPPLLV